MASPISPPLYGPPCLHSPPLYPPIVWPPPPLYPPIVWPPLYPPIVWPPCLGVHLFALCYPQVFDAGEMFGITYVEEAEEEDEEEEELQEQEMKKPNPGTDPRSKVIVTHEGGLRASNPNSIFLIDHAWTYRVDHARQQLLQVPGLFHRMANLIGLPFHGEVPDEGMVEAVLQEMWKYNQTYQLSHGSAEEKVPVWYIMDEFGSQIQHSDEPTFCTAPLFYFPQQIAFTVLWPLRDLENGEEVTRDFAYGEPDPLIRNCLLHPWRPVDITHIGCHTPEPPASYYEAIFAENKESLPVPITPASPTQDKVLKALSTERPHLLLNQFPCENLLTVKDCLASVSRRAGGPRWLPQTFNLRTELPQFISYFKQREQRGDDNHWICKPWNLARGLDTHVTTNLSYIIRQRESTPKVVCKYIEDPVLFHRDDVGLVKFDIRYVVLLRSVQPLRLYAYDVFWLRFANRPFALDELDNYEKHFTVMNYTPGVELKQVHCDEFITLFEKQNPEIQWSSIQAELFKCFRELFEAAASKPAPYGICNYPSSRAMYAIDLMLKWETDTEGKRVMQPQILEVNFNPDCARACKYHPSFFNDVFSTLFLGETAGCHVTPIL
uniref:Tubulin tyrosine ligase-like 12 n=1 Tax=Xenopus tropicalis TaxID=8364 RepID=A0A803K6H5_XENTR